MIEAHIHEWLHLLLRWIHFIVGVAWIGASFYFNWLENNLDRADRGDERIAGDLWAIHGGGIYYLKKYQSRPQSLPPVLHWFKWEAYSTWLSGVSLLIVVYYVNASNFMTDDSVMALSSTMAIGIGLSALVASWLFYDVSCRSFLKDWPRLLGILIFAWFALLAWVLSECLSPRAAYIHVGAAIGTVMVANVFFVIIPSQRELVKALTANQEPDPRFGKNGLLRSRHNNYLTLPVLFIMISGHFPGTYGSPQQWLVLSGVAAVGVLARHYFNIRGRVRGAAIWLAIAFAGFVLMIWLTRPVQNEHTVSADVSSVSDDEALKISQQRCASCHSPNPTQDGFTQPPLGIELDSVAKLRQHKTAVHRTSVSSHYMPLGNLTNMTAQERIILGQWIEAQP